MVMNMCTFLVVGAVTVANSIFTDTEDLLKTTIFKRMSCICKYKYLMFNLLTMGTDLLLVWVKELLYLIIR